MSKQFWIDAAERAIKTFAQALLAFFTADAFDVLSADWGEALTVSASAVVFSVLSSIASLRLGYPGTASATDAVELSGRHTT